MGLHELECIPQALLPLHGVGDGQGMLDPLPPLRNAKGRQRSRQFLHASRGTGDGS